MTRLTLQPLKLRCMMGRGSVIHRRILAVFNSNSWLGSLPMLFCLILLYKAPFEVGVIPSIIYFMSWIRKSKYLIQVCHDLPLFTPCSFMCCFSLIGLPGKFELVLFLFLLRLDVHFELYHLHRNVFQVEMTYTLRKNESTLKVDHGNHKVSPQSGLQSYGH